MVKGFEDDLGTQLTPATALALTQTQVLVRAQGFRIFLALKMPDKGAKRAAGTTT